jgi:predicted Rossmann-fold nucleotide-binding protein
MIFIMFTSGAAPQLLPRQNADSPLVFVRKALLVNHSYAFAIMPGVMGTVDELFEALTLIQTRYILSFPVVVGRKYWQPLLAQLTRMQEQGMEAAALQLLPSPTRWPRPGRKSRSTSL